MYEDEQQRWWCVVLQQSRRAPYLVFIHDDEAIRPVTVSPNASDRRPAGHWRHAWRGVPLPPRAARARCRAFQCRPTTTESEFLDRQPPSASLYAMRVSCIWWARSNSTEQSWSDDHVRCQSITYWFVYRYVRVKECWLPDLLIIAR